MSMQVFFAPLEGITDRDYRKLHRAYYPGIDRYYIPFISPTQDRILTPREARMVDNSFCPDVVQIPQIMSKNAGDSLWSIHLLREMGYSEINLNFGCPSGTVTGKGKGAGMLRDVDALDRYLDEIFNGLESGERISVKSRIGFAAPEEYDDILKVYRRYPFCAVILHARTKTELYRGDIHKEALAQTLQDAPWPVCPNGNIFTKKDAEAMQNAFPAIGAVMMGRGLIADPAALAREEDETARRVRLTQFTNDLFDAHLARLDVRNAVAYMKDIWFYQMHRFYDETGKYAKRLRKATDVTEFRAAYRAVLEDLPFTEVETIS